MKVYRHRKGGLYIIVNDDVTLESTLERHVLYREYSGEKIWVRPYSEFFDGRFTEIEMTDREEGFRDGYIAALEAVQDIMVRHTYGTDATPQEAESITLNAVKAVARHLKNEAVKW